jgi:hypothetical protein
MSNGAFVKVEVGGLECCNNLRIRNQPFDRLRPSRRRDLQYRSDYFIILRFLILLLDIQ